MRNTSPDMSEEEKISRAKAFRKKREGRPSLLNDELSAIIIEDMMDGHSLVDAAATAGLNVATLRDWQTKGVQAQRALDEKGTAVPENRTAMVQFSIDIKAAKAYARRLPMANIRRAGGESWQASAWLLERTAPQEYGRQLKQEITGANGGPVELAVAGSLSEAIDGALKDTTAFVTEDKADE